MSAKFLNIKSMSTWEHQVKKVSAQSVQANAHAA